MGAAGQSAPLRRTGSLLGLLGLELAAVAGLHWLGRFEGLRIGWDQPVRWLLSSPVQDVLGALLRTVGLVMAYWLLASTLLYLLASLTRLPGAVRAVGWATLPVVRRVADHAVAVTLATSMVGGGTLGMAGPALAADRGRAGPPARKPVAAAQAAFPAAQDDTTTTTAYTPEVAGAPSQETPGSGSTATTTSTTSTTTTSTTGTTTTTTAPTTTTTSTTTTTTAPATTSTTRAPTTTAPETTTTNRPTTTSTTRSPTTTTSPAAQPRYVPAPAGPPSSGSTTTAPATQTTAPPSSTTTTGPRPNAYQFPVAGTSQASREAPPPTSSGGGSGTGGGSGGSGQGSGGEAQPNESHKVKRGENLWTIARDELARARSGGSGEPTNQEVFKYWRRVIEANKKDLWSGGDPNLIFPTEPIILPPVD
jgi:hypothetical protein